MQRSDGTIATALVELRPSGQYWLRWEDGGLYNGVLQPGATWVVRDPHTPVNRTVRLAAPTYITPSMVNVSDPRCKFQEEQAADGYMYYNPYYYNPYDYYQPQSTSVSYHYLVYNCVVLPSPTESEVVFTAGQNGGLVMVAIMICLGLSAAGWSTCRK